jgi:MoxR-like ATPase
VDDLIRRLRSEVTDPLKARFVGRDEVVELMALAVVSGEHLFLHGPPGTAKSALIRAFAGAVRGRYFEYMLTRFSEPNEIFGPVDLNRLREGVVATNVAGMLPEAEFAFLDELFNANSAILNNLLTVLNERVYRRGAETRRLSLLSLFSASNHLPEDDALGALFDRFLIRCRVENLPRESMGALLSAGWAMEAGPAPAAPSGLTSADLRSLGRAVSEVDVTGVRDAYAEAAFKIRDLGVAFSDRRAVKALRLLAGSALLCGRRSATPADLWVLRYVWDRPEQAAPLAGLVDDLLRHHGADGSAGEAAGHPLATPRRADAEELARRLDGIEKELAAPAAERTVSAAARLRERLSAAADEAAWVSDERARRLLTDRAGRLLGRLG